MAAKRRDEALKRALGTPPTPHKSKGRGESKAGGNDKTRQS